MLEAMREGILQLLGGLHPIFHLQEQGQILLGKPRFFSNYLTDVDIFEFKG
jgi:hypothetical protein